MHLAPSCGRILKLVWLLFILAMYLDGSWQPLFCVSKCGLMLKCVLFPWPAEADWLPMHVHYLSAKGCSHHHWEPQEASYRLGWRVWVSYAEHWKCPRDSKQIYMPGIPSDSWMDFLIESAMQLVDLLPFNILWESYLPLSQLPPAPQSCSTLLGTLNEVRDK